MGTLQFTVGHAAVTQTHPLYPRHWSVGSLVGTAYQRPYLNARVPLAPDRRVDAPTKLPLRLASFLRPAAHRPTDRLLTRAAALYVLICELVRSNAPVIL